MKSLTFTIRGKNLRPETLPISELTKILTDLEQAFLETARARGVTDTRGLYLALKTVKKGSVTCGLATSDALADAVTHDAEQLRKRKATRIDPAARRRYHHLARYLRDKQWVGSFKYSRDSRKRLTASIGDWVPSLETEDGTLREDCLLYGVVVRVGGDPAVVDLMPLEGKRPVRVSVSREHAVELAGRLYQCVSLEGEAELDPVTLDPVRMTAHTWAPFHDQGPAAALKALAAVSGTMWDDVDPTQFVDDYRSGEVA